MFGGGGGGGDLVKVSSKRSYDDGYKYCSRCGLYYLTDGVRCPCCGTLLRSSPRGRGHRRKTKSVKAVQIPPDLERELEKIEVTVRVKR